MCLITMATAERWEGTEERTADDQLSPFSPNKGEFILEPAFTLPLVDDKHSNLARSSSSLARPRCLIYTIRRQPKTAKFRRQRLMETSLQPDHLQS